MVVGGAMVIGEERMVTGANNGDDVLVDDGDLSDDGEDEIMEID